MKRVNRDLDAEDEGADAATAVAVGWSNSVGPAVAAGRRATRKLSERMTQLKSAARERMMQTMMPQLLCSPMAATGSSSACCSAPMPRPSAMKGGSRDLGVEPVDARTEASVGRSSVPSRTTKARAGGRGTERREAWWRGVRAGQRGRIGEEERRDRDEWWLFYLYGIQAAN
ncbi:hypothetical protein SETIT_9G145200v2 [Setaria italica]|uniref:Uncharacterized protein n=1 Tax=Setaria italica TaxID=4555 RepID=A0A368SGI2_SETIT|nr:hypothetical protein SETIT_9G145200v2 [Setaria italica]